MKLKLVRPAMAFAAAALTAVAVRPTLATRTDTHACERWVDSVYVHIVVKTLVPTFAVHIALTVSI